MKNNQNHIPNIQSIADFFKIYGLGKPPNNQMVVMKLESQPDDKLSFMPLYRANFFRIIHFTKATLQSKVAENNLIIDGNCLVFSYPGKLESWERQGRLYGNVIYFTKEFAGIDLANRDYELQYPFFQPENDQIITLSIDESLLLNNLGDEMIKELNSENEDKYDLLNLLVKRYLIVVKRVFWQKIDSLKPEIKQNKSLFNKFRLVLDNHFQTLSGVALPTVALFAEKLNMSPNNLNMLIKKQTNKTASSYIQDKMMLEIKSYLIHTDQQVAEIAHKLGFENLPYFNRFFKRQIGLTPLEYRRNNKNL